jgi:3-oxoadipate enol-lactonase
MSYFTTSDGCKIYYETHGFEVEKPVMVFLNGTTQTTLHWRPQALFFKEHISVILYDARAQGKSTLGDKQLSLELHAEDLASLLRELKVAKAHLIGLSHGAHLALAVASQMPEKVDRLVLCSIGAEPGPKTRTIVRSWLEILKIGGLEAMVWAAMPSIFGEKYLKENEKILNKMVKAVVLRNRKDNLIAHFEAILTYPSPSRYAKKTRHPCLVICGSDDSMVVADRAKRLAEFCQASCAEIKHAGHTVQIEAPGLFNQMVLEFCKLNRVTIL